MREHRQVDTSIIFGCVVMALLLLAGVLVTSPTKTSSAATVNSSTHTDPVMNAAAQASNTCEVDLEQFSYTSGCTAPNFEVTLTTSQALVRIDLAPRYEYRHVRFDIHYDSPPDGWTVNIGDSSSNDGYAGDSGTQDHDAELQIVNNAFTIYGSDYTPAEDTLDGTRQLLHIPDFLAESRDVVLQIGDGYIQWDNGTGEADTLEKPYLFALAGQVDPGGTRNYTLYAAFNRVVSGRSDRVGSGVTRVLITLATQPDITAPEPASAQADPTAEPGKKGMTWGYISTINRFEITRVGCYGRPRVDGTDDGPPCDPYVGDTLCTAELPILCLKSTGAPRPDYEVPNDDYFRNGWAGGYIRVTDPVLGTALTSLAEANRLCAALGEGYRMAEFHDGGGGWAWYAYGSVPDDIRFWTYINDQDGNCWN